MIIEALQEFGQRNVKVSLDPSGKLRVDSPERLDRSVYKFLKGHKPQIIPALPNPFETETGQRVIEYIETLETEKGLNFYFNSPLQTAFDVEVSLVEAIERREVNKLTPEDLKAIYDAWAKIHVRCNNTNDPSRWTDTDQVKLFTLIVYVDGKRFDSYCANAIQIQMLTTLGTAANENVTTEIIEL